MTDYFALLQQPRRPWLDPEALKQVFHEKTLRAHPDAQAGGGREKVEAFTQLNEAYQVLREPKRRLGHLLSLEGSPPARKDGTIPAEVESLFLAVAALMQETEGVLRKLSQASSALSRSLVRAESLQRAEQIQRMLETLTQRHEEALQELRTESDAWTSRGADQSKLHRLYLQFSYLTRWIAELEEKHRALASQQQ